MKAYAVTDVGRSRSMNQDSVFASVDPVGPLSNLYMVADGMGGHQSGDLASRYLVRNLCTYIRETDGEPPEVLLRAVQQVNGELYQLSTEKPEYAGMGTTLVAATVKDGVLYVANVGDSRAYHITEDGITRITKDHSLVESMVDRGDITAEEARRHPSRNLITRALGPDISAYCDGYICPMNAGEYLLLCSDGLVNTVTDQEMLFEVIHGDGPDTCLDRLLAIAKRQGAPDNVTAVLMQKQ